MLTSITRKTTLCKYIGVYIAKRYMFRSTQAASKVTYNILDHLFGEDLCNSVSYNNPTAVLKSLMDLCFNHHKGVVQQKGVFLHAMIRNKYFSDDIMEIYKQREPSSKITYPKDAITDCRILSELPVLRAYLNHFDPDIRNIHITFDKVTANFDKQKQSNPDYIVDLISKFGSRNTYQDVKSGIFRNYTRGSIGILTYDKNKNIIPFTNKDFTLDEIDLVSIDRIKLGLQYDSINNNLFTTTLNDALHIMRSPNDLFKRHHDTQRLLWNNLQCNPEYNRSVSFRFPIIAEDIPETLRYTVYKNKFTSLLGSRSYDLNRLQDRKDIFMAMLRAYRDIDPDTIKKMQHIASVGRVEYDPLLLQTIADIIKKSI